MSSQALKAAATGKPQQDQVETPRNPFDSLKNQLEKNKDQFLPLLGNMANVEKFVRVILNAVLATPDLLDADRKSLFAASLKAAQDGLLPDGREAVLNIYNVKVKGPGGEYWEKRVQYLPMVGGLVKKLYESGAVTYVDAAAVYENDKFLFKRGEFPLLEHEPTMDDVPGKVIAVYVVVKLLNGETKREVMPRRDIEAVKEASKSANGPWLKWYAEMAIKSVIKRAYKQLPKYDAFEKIMSTDNEEMGFASLNHKSALGHALEANKAPALTNDPSQTLDMNLSEMPETIPASSYADDKGLPVTQTLNIPAPTEFEKLKTRMENAKNIDKLDEAADLISTIEDPDCRIDLANIYEEQKAKLAK